MNDARLPLLPKALPEARTGARTHTGEGDREASVDTRRGPLDLAGAGVADKSNASWALNLVPRNATGSLSSRRSRACTVAAPAETGRSAARTARSAIDRRCTDETCPNRTKVRTATRNREMSHTCAALELGRWFQDREKGGNMPSKPRFWGLGMAGASLPSPRSRRAWSARAARGRTDGAAPSSQRPGRRGETRRRHAR